MISDEDLKSYSIRDIDLLISKLKTLKRKMITACDHEFITDYGTARCSKCNTFGGWYCPQSPTHVCSYEDDDACRDHCIFCGDPEERK
jgi:hypothetical protein